MSDKFALKLSYFDQIQTVLTNIKPFSKRYKHAEYKNVSGKNSS